MSKSNPRSKARSSYIKSKDAKMSPETISLGPNGRVVIPVDFRRALGLEEGSKMTVSIDGDHLLIRPGSKALDELQKLVQKVSPKRSLVNELLAERRKEVEKE